MNAPQNPPAFPHVTQSKRAGSNTIYTHVSEGMSLRDWFAGQALAGAASTLNGINPDDFEGAEAEVRAIGRTMYLIADAMLAERAKASS